MNCFCGQVLTIEHSGQVTQAKKIAFAEWTSEQDGDLQALVKVFDSRDERFAEFRIWRDANSNEVASNHKCFNLVA
jgi:hypothetical protein